MAKTSHEELKALAEDMNSVIGLTPPIDTSVPEEQLRAKMKVQVPDVYPDDELTTESWLTLEKFGGAEDAISQRKEIGAWDDGTEEEPEPAKSTRSKRPDKKEEPEPEEEAGEDPEPGEDDDDGDGEEETDPDPGEDDGEEPEPEPEKKTRKRKKKTSEPAFQRVDAFKEAMNNHAPATKEEIMDIADEIYLDRTGRKASDAGRKWPENYGFPVLEAFDLLIINDDGTVELIPEE